MNFELFGLSGRDRRVYEALLTQPDSSIRAIAEATGINRGSVFESIKDLQMAGLVAYVQQGERKRYFAEDPETLHELLTERRRTLRAAHRDVESYVAQFAELPSETRQNRLASFYEDDEGLAAILRDVLKTCRAEKANSYLAISSPKVSAYLYNNFPHFTRERIRQQLIVRVLRQGKPLRDLAEYAETRYIDRLPHDTGCYTLIYASKVAVITVGEHNSASGVIIDNRHFAETQRQLFEAAWRASVGTI